jgi:hypothetical protein
MTVLLRFSIEHPDHILLKKFANSGLIAEKTINCCALTMGIGIAGQMRWPYVSIAAKS